MHGEHGFKAFHKTVHLVTFMGKSCSVFLVLILRYLELQDIPPERTTTEQTYQFPVCANMVCFSA